jgi:hypothetical protein
MTMMGRWTGPAAVLTVTVWVWTAVPRYLRT